METTQPTPVYDSAAESSELVSEIKGLIQYRSLLFRMIRSDIAMRYKRSLLGVVWTVLDPLLNMVIMAVVFGYLFGRTRFAFPVFLYSGLIVWNFFSQTTMSAISELMFGGGKLLGAVYLPRSIFTVASVGSNFVQLLFAMIPLIFFMLLYKVPFTQALVFLPITFVIATIFTLGFSLMISSFAVFFPDFRHFYSAILRLMMYLSGIFYAASDLPGIVGQLIKYNPTYVLVELFRSPVYRGSFPNLETLLIGSVWAILFLAFGSYVFSKRSKEFTYVV